NSTMQHPGTQRARIASLILIAALAVPVLGLSPAEARPRHISQITVKEFGGRLVIGIVATGQLQFHVSEIATPLPPRVVVDLRNAVVDQDLRTTTPVNRGNVMRVRVGQFQDQPAVARVVIDLARPIAVEIMRPAPNALAVHVPLQPVTEAQMKKASAAPVPATPKAQPAPALATPAASMGVPAVSTPPGTGLVQTAQAPSPAQPPGRIRLLEFRNVALADVLSALARLCGYNIVTDASIQGTITLRLVDVTCEDALRFILEANALAFRRLGPNLIIGDAKKLEPPAEVPETISYRLAFGDVNQVRAAVAAAVPGIRVAVDPRTNSLLITGTAAQHAEVLGVLTSLDIRIPQVVIQVHAIEVSSSVLRDLGLLDPGAGFGSFGGFVLDSANNRISFTLQTADLILFRLRALVTESKGRVISAPRIATLDGNKATILLGDKVPIFTSTSTATGITTTVSFVDVGVKLEVTPRVNVEGLMTLAIKPEVSAIAEIITVGNQSAPRIATRSAETVISVKDGQTVVFGGLISQQERKTVVKVPLLGDIPIIGELFKFTNTDVRESEVIFLITPQIVKE
ncbi:MAG: secretin N-terminal domain-containing protein, partial [bacterium]